MTPLGEQLDRVIDEMLTRGITYEEAQRELERRFIVRALDRTRGNLCQAAGVLGMHRNTLSRKLTEHRLRRPPSA